MSDQASQQQKGNAAWEFVKRYKKPLMAGGAGGGGLLYYAAVQCGYVCPAGYWFWVGSGSCIPC